MVDDRHGDLAYDAESDSIVLQFGRTIPSRPRKVWRHLLDSAHLQEWLTSEPGGLIQRRVGGEIYLPTSTSGDIVGEVTVFEPESRLAFSWTTLTFDGGDVQWLIEPAESGAAVRFEYYDDPGLGLDHFARSLATWHLVLDRFEASLAGAPVPMDYARWEQLYGDYVDRFQHMIESLVPATAYQVPKELAGEE